MTKYDAIAGYMFQADIYCPDCILNQLPTGEGEAFDGWRDATGRMSVEDNLDELAAAFGIDRYDEHSYDSDEFPKVVLAGTTHDACCESCEHDTTDHCDICCTDRCGGCHDQL